MIFNTNWHASANWPSTFPMAHAAIPPSTAGMASHATPDFCLFLCAHLLRGRYFVSQRIHVHTRTRYNDNIISRSDNNHVALIVIIKLIYCARYELNHTYFSGTLSYHHFCRVDTLTGATTVRGWQFAVQWIHHQFNGRFDGGNSWMKKTSTMEMRLPEHAKQKQHLHTDQWFVHSMSSMIFHGNMHSTVITTMQ